MDVKPNEKGEKPSWSGRRESKPPHIIYKLLINDRLQRMVKGPIHKYAHRFRAMKDAACRK